jgi:hypothetical protein
MPRIAAVGSIDIETVINSVPIAVDGVHPFHFIRIIGCLFKYSTPSAPTAVKIGTVSLFCSSGISVPSRVNFVV